MNVGVFLNSPDSSEMNVELFNNLNKHVEDSTFQDVSVFYNNIAFNPVTPKFGMFNSTDLWYYTGKLLVIGFEILSSIDSIVNKFDASILYDGTKNIMKIIDAMNRYNVICVNRDHYDYIKRVTNKEPILVESFDMKDFAEVL